MSLHSLSVQQATDLVEHLSGALPAAGIPSAIAAIDLAHFNAESALRWGAALEDENETYWDTVQAIARASSTLRARLKGAWRSAEDRREHIVLVGSAGIDWPALDKALEILAAAADERPTRGGRGRPSVKWRDRLISVVRSVYPTGAPTGLNSHFEQTVEMLLDFLGQDLQNVQRTIRSALRRQPNPPFTVVAGPHFKIE